jgi:DNA-binding MarR family transcriptional regulator
MEDKYTQRPTLISAATIDDSWRKLGNLVVLYTQYIASHLGLTATEFECQTAVREHGPLTIGELAKYCNMSTGGMTKVVDRLERQGFVRRLPDPADRRRVVVEDCIPEEKVRKIQSLYLPLSRATNELLTAMTPMERTAVGSFLERLNRIIERQMALPPNDQV